MNGECSHHLYQTKSDAVVYDFHSNHFACLLFLEGVIYFLQVDGSDSPDKHENRGCGELHIYELKKLFESNDEVFRKYLKDEERVKEAVGICKEQIV